MVALHGVWAKGGTVMAAWGDAACKGSEAEVFFEPRNYSTAVAICEGCPLLSECRAEYVDEPHGVWGGTTPADRGYREHASGRRVPKIPAKKIPISSM